MNDDVLALAWPEQELGRALLALARHAKLISGARALPPPPAAGNPALFERWVEAAADYSGFIAQATCCSHAELSAVLRRAAPAIVCLHDGNARRYLALAGASRRGLLVLTPTLRREYVCVRSVAQRLCAELERAPLERIAQWLSVAKVPERRARRARAELLSATLASRRVSGLWLLRMDSGAPLHQQLRQHAFLSRALLALGAASAQLVLTSYGWWLLGRGALGGHLGTGWLCAWALALASATACQVAQLWLSGGLVHDLAALLKQRLLCGALRLDLDSIRQRGSGRWLAMVSEADVLEGVGLSALVSTLFGALQLCGAALVIALGAGARLQLLLLCAWALLLAHCFRQLCKRRAQWTGQRFAASRSFLENVIGNRTRVVQQPPEHWHRRDDTQLAEYLHVATHMDHAAQRLATLPGRGWLVLGCTGLVPVVLTADATPTTLALALGGVLQAFAAFESLAAGLSGLAAGTVAWRQISELLRAAQARPAVGDPTLVATTTHEPRTPSSHPTLLDIRGLSFRHAARGEPVLADCALQLHAGDCLLLEGPSGGGKSTLAALLAGLRSPDSGHILIAGLDRATLGQAGWLRRIASAPQFHDNHILSASLAFNLLLAGRWPPEQHDLQEAEEICRDLGLGPLLERMPGGLQQVVGETGWQLSHGERSRVFLARALLQRSDVLVLDECFGALDPETLAQCLGAVLRKRRTVIAIAHP